MPTSNFNRLTVVGTSRPYGSLRSTGSDGQQIVDRAYGRGHIYNRIPLSDVLDKAGLAPDVVCADSAIMWTHRRAKDLDIYFLSNQSDRPVATHVSFRVANKVPEMWDPIDGN